MITLKELLKQQQEVEKIKLPMEGVLASLEKVLEDGVTKAVEEFRTEAEKTKEEMISELRQKTQEASDYVNSLTPIKGDQEKTIVGPQGSKGLKGDKGDTGESIVGKQGIQGIPGKGGSPDTGEEVVNKVNELEIKPEFQIDASHIKNLPKSISLLGGGHKAYNKIIYPSQIIGAINGSNIVFYLPEAPKRVEELELYLDNTIQENKQNFTLTGNRIDFAGFAPQKNQRMWARIFRP